MSPRVFTGVSHYSRSLEEAIKDALSKIESAGGHGPSNKITAKLESIEFKYEDFDQTKIDVLLVHFTVD